MAFARTGPLRRELAAALPERPFAVRLWDGTAVEATVAGAPTFSLRSPRALAHVLRAPGELGIGRAFVCGLLEVDDLDSALGVVDTFEPPQISPAPAARLAGAVVAACGLTRPPRRPRLSCASR